MEKMLSFKNVIVRAIKKPIRYVFLPIFTMFIISCKSDCQFPSELNTYNCNKCRSREFAACIYKNFPLGSGYQELNKYMTNLRFMKAQIPSEVQKNRFYFKWTGNLGYEVSVTGRYDFNLKIIEIEVSPS